MKARALAIRQLRALALKFLHIVLAEFPQAQLVCFADQRGREFLRYSQ